MATNEALNDMARILEDLQTLFVELTQNVKANKFNKLAPIVPTVDQKKLSAIEKVKRKLEDSMYQIAACGDIYSHKNNYKLSQN